MVTRLRGKLLWLIVFGDTTVPRCILAGAAALWSFLLFLPGDTFSRPVYAGMALFASENVWAATWGLYAAALTWRTFSAFRHITALTLAINALGVILFGGAAACVVFVKLWPAPAAVAGDVVLSIVAVWLLMRSGLNNGPGWRND